MRQKKKKKWAKEMNKNQQVDDLGEALRELRRKKRARPEGEVN